MGSTTAAESAQEQYQRYVSCLASALRQIPPEEVEILVEKIYGAYASGRQLFIAGNGGSAATASHMMNDLTKAIFMKATNPSPDRFRVLSLTDNVSVMTAWANDTSYEQVFAEQLRTYAEPRDLLLVISASGNSPNLLVAIRQARSMGLHTLGLLGFGGGKCKELVDFALVVPGNDYGPVEDMHSILGHFLAEALQVRVARAPGGLRRRAA